MSALVVASSNAPEVLKTAEHALDDVPSFVGVFVVAMGIFAGRIWRDDRFDPPLGEFLAQAVGVLGPVGENTLGSMAHCEQAARPGEVMDVAGRDQQDMGRPISSVSAWILWLAAA